MHLVHSRLWRLNRRHVTDSSRFRKMFRRGPASERLLVVCGKHLVRWPRGWASFASLFCKKVAPTFRSRSGCTVSTSLDIFKRRSGPLSLPLSAKIPLKRPRRSSTLLCLPSTSTMTKRFQSGGMYRRLSIFLATTIQRQFFCFGLQRPRAQRLRHENCESLLMLYGLVMAKSVWPLWEAASILGPASLSTLNCGRLWTRVAEIN